MKARQVTFAEIEGAKSVVEELQHRLLRECGWTYSSSNNPACFWLWTKEWNGHPLMADTATALRMEEQIQPDGD